MDTRQILSDLELQFQPQLPRVRVVRRFVQEFYAPLLDPDLVDRLAMVAHELIENAAKYSIDGRAHLRIDVRSDGSNRIRVSVSNRTAADHLSTLHSMFSDMQKVPDPFAYYQQAMRRSTTLVDESGLGLARIRAEGDMEVALVSEGDRICVEASTAIAREPVA